MKFIAVFLAFAAYYPLHGQSSLLDDVKSILIYGNADPRIYPDAYSLTWKTKIAHDIFGDYVPFDALDQDSVPSFLSNAASNVSDSSFDDSDALLFFSLERKRKPDLLLEMMMGDPFLIRLADDHEKIWVLKA